MLGRTLVPLALLAMPLPSQDPSAEPQKTLRLEAGEVDLLDLMKRAGEVLDWNILCDPREFATAGGPAKVELQTGMHVKREDARRVLSQLLYSKGLVLTVVDRENGLFEVISQLGPNRGKIVQRAESMTADAVLKNANLAVPVTVTLEVEHVNQTVLINTLRPFFAARGSGGGLTLGAAPNGGAVVISGIASEVADATRQIRELDKPPREVTPTLKQQVDQLAKKVADLTDLVARLEARIAALERDRE